MQRHLTRAANKISGLTLPLVGKAKELVRSKRETDSFLTRLLMTYQATVLPVMIASPGDVDEYRKIVRDVILEWNYVNSTATGTVLMPVGWDTHSSPELGSSAQDLINDRVLEECDLLIGIFWTRLGTPTTSARSGTVEEIERHVKAGKPAMIYFSSAPFAPESLVLDQFVALQGFKEWCKAIGIVESFTSVAELERKVRRHIQISLNDNPYLAEALQVMAPADDRDKGSAAGVPVTSLAPVQGNLSSEALTLLFEATVDAGGNIFKLATIGGRFIQVNGKTFGSHGSRSAAKWQYGLDQLVNGGFVRAVGPKQVAFEVTEPGFQLVDRLTEAGFAPLEPN